MDPRDHRSLGTSGPRAKRAGAFATAASLATVTYWLPYGIFNLAALLRARRSGWRPLLWTQWGRDWEARATPASIVALATKGVGPGSVVLLHDADDYGSPDSWRRTLGALPLLLDR